MTEVEGSAVTVGKRAAATSKKGQSLPVVADDATRPTPHVTLDDDIRRLLIAAIDMRRLIDRDLKQLSRGASLSEHGLNILTMIDVGLDRPRLLIEYFDVQPSTISIETEKLVAAGLVKRKSVSSDRRAIRLVLTPKGHAIREESQNLLNNAFRKYVQNISSSDLEACIRVLSTATSTLVPRTPSIVPNESRQKAQSRSPKKRQTVTRS